MSNKLHVAFMCIALAVCLTAPALASAVTALPDGARMLSLIPRGPGRLLVESSGKLYAFTPGDMSGVMELAAKPMYEAAVVAYCDDLMAVTGDGSLMACRGGQWEEEMRLSLDEVNRVIWAQQVDEMIVASFALEGRRQALIAAYHRPTGAARVLSEAFGSGRFYPAGERALGSLYLKDAEWMHQVMDVDTLQVTETPVQGLPYDVRAFCFDPGTATYYVATAGSVLYGPSLDRLQMFSQQGGVRDIAPTGAGEAALLTNDGIIVRRPQTEQALTLSVLGVSPPLANKYFQERGVKIVERQASVSNMEEIAAMLSTRDADIDLFCLFSDNGLGKIKEKGLFVDLSGSELLMQSKAELYPAIARRLSSKESRLMAWPVYMESWFLRVEEELLQAYGFESPDTFDELLDLFPAILDAGMLPDLPARMFDTVSFNRIDVMTYFIQQFLFAEDIAGRRPDFNNPDAQRILQKIIDHVPLQDPYPPGDGTETPLFCLANVTDRLSGDLRTGFRINPDEQPAVWSRLLVMVVNPFSPNKEEAMAYLEFLGSNRGPEAYPLFASMTEPLPDPQVAADMAMLKQELALLEEQAMQEPGKHDEAIAQKKAALNALAEHPYLVDRDSIARYQELSQYLYISEDASLLYNDELKATIAQLAQGNISLRAFAERMNQIVNLIYLEREG